MNPTRELVLPGLEGHHLPVEPQTAQRWIERGPQKRLMLFAGGSHPALAADIGEDSNIAAGAITANYRPELEAGGKHRTVIGRNVHTGSDNVFVAPVEIGDDAWIGAGSTITEDVPPGALAIARARQVNKEGHSGKRND